MASEVAEPPHYLWASDATAITYQQVLLHLVYV